MSVKDGHAREMTQLRDYIDRLRGYGETMRAELDRTKRELHEARDEIRARPPRQN